MAREVVGIQTCVSCSAPVNKAFVVTEEELEHFYEEGKRWVDGAGSTNSAICCKAELRGAEDVLTSDTVESIINYTNPRKNKIRGVWLAMVSDDKSRTFDLKLRDKELPSLISITVGGKSVPETEDTYRRLEAEIQDITQWYSLLATRRWLIRLLTWLWWILCVLYLLWVVFGVILWAHRSGVSRRIEEPRRLYNVRTDALEEPRKMPGMRKKASEETLKKEPTSTRKVWEFVWDRRFWVGVGVVLGGVFLERVLVYVFPKAIFVVGKGKDRYARLKNIRKWIGGIITTVVLLGIVVPLVKRLVWKSL